MYPSYLSVFQLCRFCHHLALSDIDSPNQAPRIHGLQTSFVFNTDLLWNSADYGLSFVRYREGNFVAKSEKTRQNWTWWDKTSLQLFIIFLSTSYPICSQLRSSTISSVNRQHVDNTMDEMVCKNYVNHYGSDLAKLWQKHTDWCDTGHIRIPIPGWLAGWPMAWPGWRARSTCKAIGLVKPLPVAVRAGPDRLENSEMEAILLVRLPCRFSIFRAACSALQ